MVNNKLDKEGRKLSDKKENIIAQTKEKEARIQIIENLALSTMQQMTKLDFTNSEYNLFLYHLNQEHLAAKIVFETHD